ncbi:hypothetical protein KBX50_08400 [Micromonospora sp. C51]|uniref:hypothetical protein n=1 Tax=Micromonospora sp. C51 TaxID=2824879 RepID=UPI001B3955C4|nr:hypothetical protein [Micromonospora sp. C51]MBQ1048483.1 hypothetical protein [Micromonospora sp. C51]
MSTPEPKTTVRLAPGDRILITEHSGYAGKHRPVGAWSPAIKVRRPSWASPNCGEPVGVHAATVERVEAAGKVGGQRRYNVVTNLAVVENCSPTQRFRPAPAEMKDSIVIRQEIQDNGAREKARAEYNRTHPQDIDRTRGGVGDLVEKLDLGGGGRAGRPCRVLQVVEVGLMGGRAHDPVSGELTLLVGGAFRYLPRPADGQSVRCSCGCPAELGADSVTHLDCCMWSDEGAPARAVKAIEDGKGGFQVHNATGVSRGETCGHIEQYEGRLLDVRTQEEARLALFPPLLFPDRADVTSWVTFADCIRLPENADALVPPRTNEARERLVARVEKMSLATLAQVSEELIPKIRATKDPDDKLALRILLNVVTAEQFRKEQAAAVPPPVARDPWGTALETDTTT